MTESMWWGAGAIIAFLALFGLCMWSLYAHEGLDVAEQRRQRASLDELLEQQNQRSCEEYIEEVRDCTCGPLPEDTDDDCPSHGREVSSDG